MEQQTLSPKHLSHIHQHISNCALALSPSLLTWTNETLEKAFGWARLCAKVLSGLTPDSAARANILCSVAKEKKISGLHDKELTELSTEQFLAWCIVGSAFVQPLHVQACMKRFPSQTTDLIERKRVAEESLKAMNWTTMQLDIALRKLQASAHTTHDDERQEETR